MTMYDYLIGMKNSVGIAELKSRLSHYLRVVRRGEEITVLARDTPVARLVPLARDTTPLVVREPAGRVRTPGEVALPPPLDLDVDVVQVLIAERGER